MTRPTPSTIRLSVLAICMIIIAGMFGNASAQRRDTNGRDANVDTNPSSSSDFNGDGLSDIVFFESRTGRWHVQNLDGSFASTHFGGRGEVPVAADYDGDSIVDLAVIRRENREFTWRILQSSDQVEVEIHWGVEGDVPVQGDYDGDGKDDVAIWRPSDGTWYIFESGSQQLNAMSFGFGADKPLPADYDGDGRFDVAVFRPQQQMLYRVLSNGFIFEQVALAFEVNLAARPSFVSADFDGDGRADPAMFNGRDLVWTILESMSGEIRTEVFENDGTNQSGFDPRPSQPTFVAYPADYDGDGIIDAGVLKLKDNSVMANGSMLGAMRFGTDAPTGMIAVTPFLRIQ